jgi:hypothetical protein
MASRPARVPATDAKKKEEPLAPVPALRVSQVIVSFMLLDQFDAPKQDGPHVFENGPDGTATDKAQAFLASVSPTPSKETSS